MINLNTSQLQPNIATLNDAAVQASLPETEESRERYTLIMQMFPRMAASYLPTHPILATPPVHYAAIRGSVDQLAILEPFLSDTTKQGLTPLHYALAYKQTDAIRFLADKCDLSLITPDGNSYLHYAALTGDPDIVEIFLNRGLDPNIRNKDSLSAAHLWAFRSNDLTILQKISPSEPSEPYSFTPLQLMALNAAHADNMALSDDEMHLFYANILDLGVIGLSKLCQDYRIQNYATSFLELTHTGLVIGKAYPIHNLAPSKLKPLLKPSAVQQIQVNQWMPITLYHMPPYAMALQSLPSTTAVAWNTLTKISQLAKLSWKSALAAVAVRSTNMFCSLFDARLAFRYYRYEGEHCYADQMRSLQEMSDEELQDLPDLAQQCWDKFPKLHHRGFPVEGHSKETKEICESIKLKIKDPNSKTNLIKLNRSIPVPPQRHPKGSNYTNPNK